MPTLKLIGSLLLLATLTACVPQNKSVIKDKTSSSGLTTLVNDIPSDHPGPPGSGSGSGSSSGSGSGNNTPGSGTGSGSGELVEFCGELYRSKNGYYSYIDGDNSKYYIVYGTINNAKSVLDSLIFPNDSYNTCMWGTTRQTVAGFVIFNIIDANFVELESPLAHPERKVKADMFSQDLCGTIQYITDPGKTTPHLQINTSTKNYILKDTTSGKKVEAALVGKSSIKGCVYSNKAAYYNYAVTFRPYLDVQDLDVGW
jgi:hypothetical protein